MHKVNRQLWFTKFYPHGGRVCNPVRLFVCLVCLPDKIGMDDMDITCFLALANLQKTCKLSTMRIFLMDFHLQ